MFGLQDTFNRTKLLHTMLMYHPCLALYAYIIDVWLDRKHVRANTHEKVLIRCRSITLVPKVLKGRKTSPHTSIYCCYFTFSGPLGLWGSTLSIAQPWARRREGCMSHDEQTQSNRACGFQILVAVPKDPFYIRFQLYTEPVNMYI